MGHPCIKNGVMVQGFRPLSILYGIFSKLLLAFSASMIKMRKQINVPDEWVSIQGKVQETRWWILCLWSAPRI